MTITVNSNVSEALAHALANRISRASHEVATNIKSDTEPYVPMLTRSLVNRTKVVGDTVIYPGPYAARLYYGSEFNFTKDFHPLARAFWFEASKAQNADKWLNIAKRAVSKYGG